MEYKVYAKQSMPIWAGTIKADSKEEAINTASRINYKSGLMMKYMDNLEANQISSIAEPYLEEE